MAATGPVFLTGFMGTGKSTVGRALARRLGTRFVDSDAEIERRERMSVAQIFAERGEAEFRRAEANVLAELAAGDAVVALGGGAIVADDNYATLHRSGPIVCLCASVDEIVRRVGRDGRRPLLAGENREARIRELLAARREAYARADVQIDTTGVDVNAVVDRIVAFLGKRGVEEEEGA